MMYLFKKFKLIVLLIAALFASGCSQLQQKDGAATKPISQLQQVCIDQEAEYQCRVLYGWAVMRDLTKAVRQGYAQGTGFIPKDIANTYYDSLGAAELAMEAAEKAAAIGDAATAKDKVKAALNAVDHFMYLLN